MDGIDRIPVTTLPDRYSIGRTALYERMGALKIRPEKDGNRSFISSEQLSLLDALAEHIKKGGTTPGFCQQFNVNNGHGEQSIVHQAVGEQSEQPLATREPDRLWLLIEALATRLQTSPPDPLTPQRQLEEIAKRGWVVTSSQLREVLGVQPREGEQLGFRLVKVGRVGRESGWKVEKSSG